MCAWVHDTYNIQYIFFILLSIKIIDHSYVLYRMYLFIVLVSECMAHVTTSTTLVSSTNYLTEVTIHHLLGWTLPNLLLMHTQYNTMQYKYKNTKEEIFFIIIFLNTRARFLCYKTFVLPDMYNVICIESNFLFFHY